MFNRKKIARALLGTSLLMLTSISFADMTLDKERSQLSFFSVKNNTIGENHRIPNLSGTLSDKGDLTVILDLKSVYTKIPLRDERMNDVLFETKTHPEATITASISDDLSKPGLKTIQTEAILSLHGVTKKITIDALLVRSEDKLIATNVKPILISASDFKLDAGVAKLQELAKLASISQSVPVNFVLVFSK